MKYPLLTVGVSGRSCGPCNACCVAPACLSTEKPKWVPCRHLDGNCTIYEDRPEECRNYECLWREGFIEGDERRRPDQLGIIFELRDLDGKTVISAWELWEGAADNSNVNYFLQSLGQKGKMPVVLRRFLDRTWKVYPGSQLDMVRLSLANEARHASEAR